MSARQTAADRWAVTNQKLCNTCGLIKPLPEFTIRHTGKRKGHPMSQCKACCVKRQTRNYNADTYNRVTRPYQLKKKYGITPEDYTRMLEEQGGICKICGTDDPKGPHKIKTFSIDHCHDSGSVRGLLCNRCNRALGMFEDDLELLNKVTKYLNDFKEI